MLIAAPDKRVLYLSQTYEGSAHDKRVADEEALEFGADDRQRETVELLQDLGFQGYKPKGVVVLQPMKKPKGGQLTQEQKKANQAISLHIPVVIGHPFRSKPATRSVPGRPPIPVQNGHPFRATPQEAAVSYRKGAETS